MDLAHLLAPGPEAGLAALFVASFLAATLLPGGSEIVLAALLWRSPELLWPALALATLGNTLGGLTSYAIGRLCPARVQPTAGLARMRRHGAPALCLAWAPLIGDALCVAAGWLRLPWAPCLGWMALGKFVRYALVAAPLA